MNASLAPQPTVFALPVFQTVEETGSAGALITRFQHWLQEGGYAQTTVATNVAKARWLVSLLPAPLMIDTPPNVFIDQIAAVLTQHADLSRATQRSYASVLKKLREFLYGERGWAPPTPDPLALPSQLADLPVWLREPLERYLRLKQRNWSAAIVQHQTRGLFHRLRDLCQFFIREYGWTEWSQLSVRWVDAYIETCLRRELTPTTINCTLFAFQGFGRFLSDEGYPVPTVILHAQPLNVPHRLPRPLADDQVRQLERTIQTAADRPRAIMDLAWFYLLWHCGLRVSEVHQLTMNNLDLAGHKLLVRAGKARKDRWVYVSDTAVQALRHHLDSRPDREAPYVFTSHRHPLTTRALQRRLTAYGRQAAVAVTPHRLRHTFASQMLAAGMPVTSLQRYLGHEDINLTMRYAQVSDAMLQQDYYQGITLVDPDSAKLSLKTPKPPDREELRQLVTELRTLDPTSPRYAATLEQIQRLLSEGEGGDASDA
jgi:integrase/recombinase XerD